MNTVDIYVTVGFFLLAWITAAFLLEGDKLSVLVGAGLGIMVIGIRIPATFWFFIPIGFLICLVTTINRAQHITRKWKKEARENYPAERTRLLESLDVIIGNFRILGNDSEIILDLNEELMEIEKTVLLCKTKSENYFVIEADYTGFGFCNIKTIAYSHEEAKEWVKNNVPPLKFESIFGAVEVY